MNKVEVLECLKALLLRAMIDDETRLQKGLELPETSPLIGRMMSLLSLSEEVIEKEADKAGEDLWEYSWYAFTSEWAWYRAQQDALRFKSKQKKIVNLQSDEYKQMTEKLYKKFFDKYVAELNMRPIQNGGAIKPKQPRSRDKN